MLYIEQLLSVLIGFAAFGLMCVAGFILLEDRHYEQIRRGKEKDHE